MNIMQNSNKHGFRIKKYSDRSDVSKIHFDSIKKRTIRNKMVKATVKGQCTKIYKTR